MALTALTLERISNALDPVIVTTALPWLSCWPVSLFTLPARVDDIPRLTSALSVKL